MTSLGSELACVLPIQPTMITHITVALSLNGFGDG